MSAETIRRIQREQNRKTICVLHKLKHLSTHLQTNSTLSGKKLRIWYFSSDNPSHLACIQHLQTPHSIIWNIQRQDENFNIRKVVSKFLNMIQIRESTFLNTLSNATVIKIKRRNHSPVRCNLHLHSSPGIRDNNFPFGEVWNIANIKERFQRKWIRNYYCSFYTWGKMDKPEENFYVRSSFKTVNKNAEVKPWDLRNFEASITEKNLQN